MVKRIEYILKNLFINILKLISRKSTVRKDNPLIVSDSKVLFIRLNRIGDALITTPLIDLFKRKRGCRIYVLADKKNYFVFSNNPNIDKVIVYHKNIKSLFSVFRFIKKGKIDAIVDLHDDVSTTVSLLVTLANCKYKLGLHKSNREIYTHTIPRIDASSNHVIERILELSKLLGFSYSKDEIKIGYYPKTENVQFAKEYIHKTFPEKKFLIGINISAGSDARFWGINNFRLMLKEIKKYNVNILLFSAPKDLDKAESITDRQYIYPVSKEFDKFAAGILELDFLFSPDTSAIHIASIKKIPVFGLYVKYKTNDLIWSPYNTDFECVITEDSNLENVSFEEVIKNFKPFFEKYFNGKRNSQL